MISREIGSEFWDIELQDKDNLVFDDETQWFISGRAALNFIIKDIKAKRDVKTALLPSWCCDTMIKPFIDNDIDVEYYSVFYDGKKLVKMINKKADILLNLDYFGYEDKHQIEFDGIVINDITHSLFVDKKEADYYFGSLRKWTGIVNGGFAYCEKGFKKKQKKNTCKEYNELRYRAMDLKSQYIDGEFNNKEFLNKYNEAENMLDELTDCSACDNEVVKARSINVDYIKRKRQENAKRLLTQLDKYAIFKKVGRKDSPLFVPIIVPHGKRDELRNYLISKNIYCPVHWPISNYHIISYKEQFLYENELSLVCDQRYSLEDMDYIIKCVEEFLYA